MIAVFDAFRLGAVPRPNAVKEFLIGVPGAAVYIDVNVHIGTLGADVYDVALSGIAGDQRFLLIDFSQRDFRKGTGIPFGHP